jgi:hypothetical protein
MILKSMVNVSGFSDRISTKTSQGNLKLNLNI